MIRHVVLLTLNDPDAQHDADRLMAALRALPEVIDEIVDYEVGRDLLGSEAHIGIVSTFKDLDALERYRVHPAHLAAVDIVTEVCASRLAYDAEM